MATKICRKCKIEKPLYNFSYDKKNADGHVNFCKECRHKHYLANKEKINAHNKERYHSLSIEEKKERQAKAYKRYLKNKDWYKDYYTKNKDKWKKYNTEKKRQYSRGWKLKNKEHVKKYNHDNLDKKLEWQNNKMKTDPKSWFNYSNTNDPEFKKAWALSNLQPLWAEDNLRKGNSFAGRV